MPYHDNDQPYIRKLSKFKQLGAISLGDKPELRLMTSVLMLAFADLKHKTPRVRREALAWIMSDDAEWPYNFQACCLMLSLTPSRVRERALLLTQEH